MSPRTDPRIDAYIAKSAEFARPILTHLRALVHEGCPEVAETIKWGMPSFTQHDNILCIVAGFKAHCALTFWHHGMEAVIGRDQAAQAMGSFGRITSLKDLPADKVMLGYIRQAVKLNASGAPARLRPVAKGKPKPMAVPEDLAAALKKNKKAAAVFAAFSPSKRKDYIEWLTEAKREETRAKRLATAIEWIAEGKARNWKYESC